jgi:hypothetical protein
VEYARRSGFDYVCDYEIADGEIVATLNAAGVSRVLDGEPLDTAARLRLTLWEAEAARQEAHDLLRELRNMEREAIEAQRVTLAEILANKGEGQ